MCDPLTGKNYPRLIIAGFLHGKYDAVTTPSLTSVNIDMVLAGDPTGLYEVPIFFNFTLRVNDRHKMQMFYDEIFRSIEYWNRHVLYRFIAAYVEIENGVKPPKVMQRIKTLIPRIHALPRRSVVGVRLSLGGSSEIFSLEQALENRWKEVDPATTQDKRRAGVVERDGEFFLFLREGVGPSAKTYWVHKSGVEDPEIRRQMHLQKEGRNLVGQRISFIPSGRWDTYLDNRLGPTPYELAHGLFLVDDPSANENLLTTGVEHYAK